MKARTRMIVDLPVEVQMAIRLRAVKNGWTMGQAVETAIRQTFPADVRDAQEVLEQQDKKGDAQ